MSKLLRRNSRKFSAATLIAGAIVLLMFVFVDRSKSANPTSGTIGPMGPNVVWDGTAAGGTSQLSEDSCVEGFSCDTFTLTISGDPSDWTGKQVHLQFDWLDAANDYDIYVHKGDNNGPIVGSSVNTHLSGHTESIDLDPSVPSIGTGVFSVHIVYFIVAPQTGIGPPPANDQYHAVASVTAAVAPTPTPTPGASPTPTAPPLIPPGTPRLHNHYAPTGVADDAGEPTIGSNWQSEQSFSNNNIVTGAANPAIPNGGTTNYFGGFLSYMLRVRFNDCASPAIAPFEKMPIFLAATTRVFGDPILFTDHLTGRTFVAQLEGLTPVGSTIDFTDDDGDTFQPSQGAGPSCVDHQTIGGGAFHEPLPPGLVYPHAVYYASQCISNATSELSLDGGVTFPIESNMFTASDCAGLHGHIKIAPDGTAYVPDKACATAGVPLLLGGEAAVIVSENNGLTWSVRTVPGATSTASVDDASVGVSWCPPEEAATCDKAARSNTIYLGFMFADGRAGIAKSNDKGLNWTPPVDVGAQVGVKHIAFPAVAVGDPDRAAFAFFGTTTSGNYSAPEFPGVWHLYLATTFDGGATWTTQNLTPDDPIQRGGICTGGTCRNLLDFFDMAIDKRGRLLIAGEDGCIGSCVNGGPNSFTAKAFISRQAGGKRMFSVFDPVEPALPGAPRVAGGFDKLPPTKAILSWPVPDNGGSPITAYKVYHAAAAGGPFTLLATVPVNNYTDTALQADNYYRVTAVNGVGEGPYCSEFRPVGVPPNTCALPGLLVQDDFNRDGTDKDSNANTPPDPRVNLRQLYVGEPFFGAGVNKLIFTMQVAPSPGATTAPPNSQWFIIWNRITGPTADGSDRNYVAMRSDSFGEVSFEYGTFGPPLDPTAPVPNANTPLKVGDADEGTFNPETGVITITISNDKVENIGVGFDLAGMACRTYFNRPDPGQRSTNNASDVMEETLYSLRGNAFCGIIEIGKLLNISTREQVETGDNVLIGGFIITGSAPKKVIMRGIGPSLQKDGGPFAGRMEDPTLELHDATGVLATNNDWKENQAEVEATGIPPTHDKESAIVRTLAPGAYTVILRGFQNTTGIALVEAYDLEAVGASEMANISTRGLVGTGDNILIGGFFTGPNTAAHTKVVVRAIGPSIQNQLPNALNDPTLELRDQFGALIGANDNWKDGQQAEIQAAGLAPTADAESALIKTLVPGPYTALVRGANNTTGVGLVEVYHIP
jgi:hypothetical protein